MEYRELLHGHPRSPSLMLLLGQGRMALPTYLVSSSVVNVDCLHTTKVILLPPASTIQGMSLTVRDCAGFANSDSTIYVSTQGLDKLDRTAIRVPISTPYQSIRFAAWKPTEYAILQNYTLGLTPFLVRFTQGLFWTSVASTQTWSCVAISSSGAVQLAGIGSGGGRLYRSVNQGVTWSATGPSFVWTGVAMSSSGANMVAVSLDDRIYTSLDTGASWTPRAFVKPWSCVCSSSDGLIFLAGTTGDTLYVSTDTGVTWTSTNTILNYTSVACSSDGSIMYAVTAGDKIYVSTDTGSTWTGYDSNRNWTGVACSSDGTTAFATEGTYIYKSTTTGTSWIPNTGYVGAWTSITCSDDASIVVAMNSTTSRLNFSESYGASFVDSGTAGPYTALAANSASSVVVASANPGTLYVGVIQLL